MKLEQLIKKQSRIALASMFFALRKPLVMNAGRIQQLQAADTLDAVVAETNGYNFTNGDVSSHTIGQIVYLSAADTAKLAKADAIGTTDAIAIATATIIASGIGNYQSDGVLAGLTGLTAGAKYYLSDVTAGLLTLTAPTTLGHYVCEIGEAISTTELLINPKQAILL